MNKSKKKEIFKVILNSGYIIFLSLIVAGSGVLHTHCSGEITFTLIPGIIGGIIMFVGAIYYLISNTLKITRRKEDISNK